MWYTAWQAPPAIIRPAQEIIKPKKELLRPGGLVFPPMSNVGSWQTTLSVTLNTATSQTFNNGQTMRIFIPQSVLSITGGSLVRVTMSNVGGTNDYAVADARIQQAVAAWALANAGYASTPIRMQVGASNTWTISASSGTTRSDNIAMGIPTSNGLCIAFASSSATNVNFAANASSPTGGITGFASIADDTANVSPGSYTGLTGTPTDILITLIEVFK
jgi:hypothetical protein